MAIRVQATLPMASGLGTDVVVNTWHFAGATITNEDAVTLLGHLADFYGAIDQYLSNRLTGDIIFKGYRTDDPEPRAPIGPALELDAAFVPGGTPLPEECAMALGFWAAPISGVAMGRRRGRVFLGPLSSNAVLLTTGGHRITPECRTDVTLACANLVADTAALGHRLSVYSRTDDQTYAVQYTSMDDTLDTIRSRGPETLERTTQGPLP